MTNVYCEYCGQKYTSAISLTGGYCQRHPAGTGRGRHKLYEGTEKPRYTCKYCGQAYSNLMTLAGGYCQRHPNGSGKGRHAPAL